MKNFFVPEYAVMDFEFYDLRNVNMHYHQNVEMLMVLEGQIRLMLDEGEILLGEHEFYVINVNRRHAIKADEGVLYVCIHMNFNLLARYIDMNRVILMCHSQNMAPGTRREFKGVLEQIVSNYFAKTGTTQVKLNVLYYSLLNLLIEFCMVYSDDERFENRNSVAESRLNEIVNYVYANYRDEIRLSDLAEQLYLSTAYLSKYIKNRMGMNFIDYVNSIRLHHAVEEIRGSDKKMTHIAVDNGFANVTAFNKAFKKIYDITPTEFREQEKGKELIEKSREIQNTHVTERAQQYLESHDSIIDAGEQEEVFVLADVYEQRTYNKYWKQMINIGRMSDLLMSSMQNHLLTLKKELKFTYVRFWDIYAIDLNLNIEARDGVYNFGKMDLIFDFLFENQIYPYIELGFKPTILVEKLDGYIISEEKEILFKSMAEYRAFLYAMITHYVNRYGIEEVEHWYFEQWKDPRMLKEGDYQLYFETFETAYHTIKSVSSKIKIGGGSIHYTFDELIYEDFLLQWQKRIVHPDFISIYSYPYRTGAAGQAIDRRRSQNPNYLRDRISDVREVLSRIGFGVSEIHVSEWNSSVSNRNPMNDSVYKGAYAMKNIIDNMGKVDVLGYWLGSDLFSQYRDQNKVLCGGVGLLSRDGIRKPSFYAFDFMNHMGGFRLGQYENSFITSNGHDDYYIVNHNLKKPNYKYYKMPENEVDMTKTEQYFEDVNRLKINCQISHVKNGRYQIKVHRISAENGSALDAWIKMGQFSNLTISDVDYLKTISTPRIKIWESVVTEQELNFETVLEVNEIQYIHITYRF